MRGMQVRSHPRRIVRPMMEAAQTHRFAEAERTEEADQRDVGFVDGGVWDGQEVQEVLWKRFFASTAQCWDNRRSKRTPQLPDFKHKKSKVPLWVNNPQKPVWVDKQLASVDASSKLSLKTESTWRKASAAAGDHSEVEMCMKLCVDGLISDAVDTLDLLVQRGCHVPNYLFYRALKRCIQDKDLALGRRIHALTVRSGYEGDAFLATHLIGFYASHGRLEDALEVFSKVSTPDVYNGATIISAFYRHGKAAESIQIYRRMCEFPTFKPDDRLYLAVLKACAAAKDVITGREIHAHVNASAKHPGGFVLAGLLNMYIKCGFLEDARSLFDEVSEGNVVAWTTIIAGYAKQGMGQEALNLYSRMLQHGLSPDAVTYVCLLKACASIGVGALHDGKQLHAQIEARGLQGHAVVGGSLVNMYAKCGSLVDARKLFDKLSDRNIIAWTSMIAGYAQQRMGKEALTVYRRMQHESLTPDSVTYVCLLQACASIGVGALHEGKQLHAQVKERGLVEDAVLGGSLVDMYAKCGSLRDASEVFNKLPNKNVVACTAMIAGYAQQGMAQEALNVYRSMQQENLTPDSVTYLCLLQACASVGAGALDEGKELHAQIEEKGMEGDAVVGGSLVNMYAKCGSLEEARRLFDKLPDRNVIAWTAIIGAYAQQGEGYEALSLYSSMKQEGLGPSSVTYLCLLQACARIGVTALHEGKQLHAQIQEQGLEKDVVVGGALVNMYTKCGSLNDARGLFDKLPARNVVTWNTMIAGYAQQGLGQDALNLYIRMQEEGFTSDSVTYLSLLQACASVGASGLQQGKLVHAEIAGRGLETDAVLGSSLVDMYAKCGSLQDAKKVLDKLPEKDIVACTAMVAGYVQQRMGQEAINLYSSMLQEGLCPDSVTFVRLLQACSTEGVGALAVGKQLHVHIEEQGLVEDAVVGGSLINMYVKCGCLENAHRLFENLPHRNVVAWTAMISGYAQQGMGQEALHLYSSMQKQGLRADAVTYLCLLQACASVGEGALNVGKQLHVQITEENMEGDEILGGGLVNMYAKCGSVEDAHRLFEELPKRNVAAWTAMIAGYVQQEMGLKALDLHKNMQQEGLLPDTATYVCLLQACAGVGVSALQKGKQLHVHLEEHGLGNEVVSGTLVNMYVKCGSLEDARRMFDQLSDRSIVAWTAMISGYAQQGMGEEALSLFHTMQLEGVIPDSVTYVSLLQACASVGVDALDEGKQLHVQIGERGLEEDVVLGGSLVNMYAKCGSLEDARRLFGKLPNRNIIAWNAMIAGYAQQGMAQDALELYNTMQQEGLSPNSVTYVSLLQACATVAALPLGEQLHAQMEGRGMQADGKVGAALVNMYAKCGSLCDSQQVFDSLSERSVEAWNALICGYARQGDSQVVFNLLDRMTSEGIYPNEITFLSVLTVCSHVGLLDKGQEYFEAMTKDFGISVTMDHYICMVDLLGRAGHLQKALRLVCTMPSPPNDVVWLTLLGACWKWKNVEIGQQAFKGVLSVDENDAAAYVLMSNIYASSQMWEAAKEMKARRLKLGAWKKPGQSWWTDSAGVVHTFLVGDKKHPEWEGIYRRLEQLIPKIKKEGYVPHVESLLVDVPDEKKQAELCEHSEKLAIAYALNKTAEGTTIRIVKNLRVCEDCHAATAYISKVEKRTIVCRDASRFHVYKEGKCSCGDYW